MLLKEFTDPENPDMKQWWFMCPGCGKPHCINGPADAFNGDFENPTISMPHGTIYNKNKNSDIPISETRQCWITEIRDGRIHYHPNTHHQFAGKSAAMIPIPAEVIEH